MKDDFHRLLPRVIAGPCSAESPEQVDCAASALKGLGIEWFRAGVWKPRTRPGCFEGAGLEAIPWLVGVKERYGLKICTEVASAKHVEACLDAGFDMLWIGARTTSNPFLVQELAEALKGSDVEVFVKNPITPDPGLWSGAIERLRLCGLQRLSVIYRGFQVAEKVRYRNAPCWDIAIAFRTSFPDIPFYCDPSHMGGDAAFVGEIAQKALDLGLDGLMIETHPNPSEALSDRKQQLTPAQLETVLHTLKIRESDAEDTGYRSALSALRDRIDSLDETLVDILAARMEACREIGRIKKANNVAILQTGRWEEVRSAVASRAADMGLDPDFVMRMMNDIHDASVKEQNIIISKQ